MRTSGLQGWSSESFPRTVQEAETRESSMSPREKLLERHSRGVGTLRRYDSRGGRQVRPKQAGDNCGIACWSNPPSASTAPTRCIFGEETDIAKLDAVLCTHRHLVRSQPSGSVESAFNLWNQPSIGPWTRFLAPKRRNGFGFEPIGVPPGRLCRPPIITINFCRMNVPKNRRTGRPLVRLPVPWYFL
jgi:hypothetical protein